MLFVGTKKQARDAIQETAEAADMPYVNHRWLGGLLTNFQTISLRIKRLHDLERYETEGQLQLLPTRERMAAQADLEKLRANLGGVKNMQRVPDAVFVIDLKTEAIAVREAQRLRIPIIGLVDTNCDPDGIDYVIPGNDDAIRSCAAITRAIGDVVSPGPRRVPRRGGARPARARAPGGRGARAPGGRGAGASGGRGAGQARGQRQEAEERARQEAEQAAEAAAAEAAAQQAAAPPAPERRRSRARSRGRATGGRGAGSERRSRGGPAAAEAPEAAEAPSGRRAPAPAEAPAAAAAEPEAPAAERRQSRRGTRCRARPPRPSRGGPRQRARGARAGAPRPPPRRPRSRQRPRQPAGARARGDHGRSAAGSRRRAASFREPTAEANA